MNDLIISFAQFAKREVVIMCLPTQGADLGNDVKIEGGSTDFAHRGTAYGIVLGMTDGQ